jgi:hypothetical protein
MDDGIVEGIVDEMIDGMVADRRARAANLGPLRADRISQPN